MEAEKVRGKLYPSDREIELYRKRFVEAAGLQGRIGLLHQVDTKNTETKFNDSKYYYLKPVNVSYFLVNNPKLKLIQKYGWSKETKGYDPLICYLTFKDINGNNIEPTEGSILEISAREKAHESSYLSQKYDIVDMHIDFDMNMFVCNLVTHRDILEAAHTVNTKSDPVNENKWLTREDIIVDDILPDADEDRN